MSKNAISNAVSVALVEATDINVPRWMSQSEALYLAHNAKMEWEKMVEPDQERFIEMASRNVKLALILDRIRDDEPEAQLSDQEVFDMIKENLQKKSPSSVDDMLQEMNRTGYLQILMTRLRDERALDFLISQAKLVA